MAKLKYLVIHCTATVEGKEVTSEQIRHWHTDPEPKGRGWKQVGYTDMIHLDGRVERLVDNNEDANVDPWEITNGAKGYNSVSRHIVYVGGVEETKNSRGHHKAKDTRTPAQKRAMADYVKDFHRRFPDVRIVGHRDFPNVAKACPSFDVATWLESIGIKQ
jgi:hypothetical protein